MKSIMNMLKIIGLLALSYLMFSCKKDIEPTKNKNPDVDTLFVSHNFLFNVPIIADTVFIDKQYNIDIRIELEGYSIDSVTITNNERIILVCDTTIISSRYFCDYENPERVEFLIRSVNLKNKDTVYFKSKPILFKAVENLSNRYVYPSIDDGKLKLIWQEFDKNNTQKYFVERWMVGYNLGQSYGTKKYYKTFEVVNAIFLDNYYVGEEVEYKITIINNDGNKQDIWYYKKNKEQPNYYVTQNSTGGYNLHFSKCKYFNNFEQYYCLTYDWNYNPIFIHSTNQITDTILILADAKFGDEARFSLRYLPNQFPDGFLEDDLDIYGKYLYAQYGESSFHYSNIVILDDENVACTWNGKIFLRNVITNQIVDSIVNSVEFLRATPSGKYIYAAPERTYNPPLYFWSTTPFSPNPIYTFQINFIIPPVSDNLITIMPIPSQTSSRKLALYNVTNGQIIYITNFDATSNYPTVSPNGDFFFISDMGLKFCSYVNDTFKVIWSENDWWKFYRFYNFNRLNNDLCYVWDDNKIFSIKKTIDFSEINSFPLELEEIIDIDYYSNKIIGYVTGKVIIYDLNNGNLIKEIPANLSELFSYSNKTVLLNNTIYNNHGIKYELNQ